MKLFIVMSDTHGDIKKAEEVIGQYPQISSVIHLGDYYRDALILKTKFPALEFTCVSGNCDFLSAVPNETALEAEGKRILLTHGHNYGVKYGTGRLETKAKKEGFDAVLFGHTHIPLNNYTSVLMLNPGSLAYPRGISGCTYALLEVSGKRMEARILDC
jgi:putative phosphoesterase